MHTRHRSPGNGYRSSSIGMGVAAASRNSPDGAVRSHEMYNYNSEYRNYNRGFGRGQPKPFQLPQPPPRRGDVFMEAGRLATEYLVSKGVLPQNVFSGKWQNVSLKNQGASFQGFRSQEGDNLHLQAESRTSALARLGDAVTDVDAGRRRFPDEFNPIESRNFMRGRRRMGSFKNYGSEWNREMERSASWSEKSAVSLDKDGTDDAFSGYQEEQQLSSDNGERKSISSEVASKSEAAGNSESPFEKSKLLDDVASKASSSTAGKDLMLEVELEPNEKPESMSILNGETGEAKDDGSNDEMEKQNATEDLHFQQSGHDDRASENGSDLLSLCRFAKVPTKTRSSLTIKGLRMDAVAITENENTNERGLSVGSGETVVDVSFDGSSGDPSSNPSQTLKSLDPGNSKLSPQEDFEELDLSYGFGQRKCTRSRSFPERSLMNVQESSEGPPGFGRCSSMDIERGEKRSIEHTDIRDDSKKPREWAPSIDAQMDDYLHLSTSRQQQSSREGRNSPDEEVILAAGQKKLLDISIFPNGVVEPCIEYAEEKQLFPGSFKICDLNLMEASDPNDNHEVDPILSFPSITQSQREAKHIDIDLSMTNSCNTSEKYCGRGANGKEVEVIDLESHSVQDDKALDNTEQRDETLFSGLESFTNHSQNVNDIPDVQDGYGLMISELLGADMPNCSSVPPDVNTLHNEMGLNNGEGILGDDDSIYMSLGEIPISFLRVWEQQPSQEYEKPF